MSQGGLQVLPEPVNPCCEVLCVIQHPHGHACRMSFCDAVCELGGKHLCSLLGLAEVAARHDDVPIARIGKRTCR